MATPSVLILRAPGTNCDLETAFAFEAAGASPRRVHILQLLENAQPLDDSQILCIPGGFSYGDDVAAGKILANQLQHHLAEVLSEFKEKGKLILGICNGFQVLIKSNLLFEKTPGTPAAATLTWNHSGVFDDRWVRLRVEESPSVFLKGIDTMYLPIAHAEGRFVTADGEMFDRLQTAGHLCLRYAPLDGDSPPEYLGDGILAAPDNPNGSMGNVAGACDTTGRVLGLMPHPERHIDPTQHPRWTRGEAGREGDGLALFRNAVAYFE
jgi:phosphoribosylformylglycinamidine synthase